MLNFRMMAHRCTKALPKASKAMMTVCMRKSVVLGTTFCHQTRQSKNILRSVRILETELLKERLLLAQR